MVSTFFERFVSSTLLLNKIGESIKREKKNQIICVCSVKTKENKKCFLPDRSAIKQKTFDPVWNETFIHEVENASTLGITVFHKAPIDDVFNANATISFEDLIARNQQDQTDFWVDLEPSGRLHVKIDLRWSQGIKLFYKFL